jgi:hypothetical protein
MRRFERLMADHAAAQTGESLMALGQWLVRNATLHVPVDGVPVPGQGLPVICVPTALGMAVPVFSSSDKLAAWKPGAQYADIPGRILLDMADRMVRIEGLYVDIGADPHAWIPRNAFATLLKL